VNTKDLFVQWWSRLHEAGYRATGGRALNQIFGMPVVVLTTTGRRTGQPRTTMLATPVEEEARIVLVASNGGDPRDPAWFLNIQENPDVEIIIHGETRQMRARIATAAEKQELWPRAVAAYYGYARYQTWTDREIPLVILEPSTG
jgi:deazaflavin-dependent oxidoreductase (nitroreductase family)